ncbi:MAG: hypothetical protein BWY42_00196 [Candidatus Omnitrophica bacterium ADurb.Bin277]|nr:MAG: hypothetical protein BWY42_00196 [Candidatus Omnitrophica bacterium ADurb.Bin277]
MTQEKDQEIEKEEDFGEGEEGFQEVDITEILEKINERLELLEKKLDTLIAKSEDGQGREDRPRRSFDHRKPFGRPFRPGGGGFHRGRRDDSRGSFERPQHGNSGKLFDRTDRRPGGFGGKKRFGGRRKGPRRDF